MMKPILLASRSPRRSQLLMDAGLSFRVDAVETRETAPTDLNPEKTALHIAGEKAQASAALRRPGEWLIAADTVVAVDGTLLAKPVDAEDASRMLRLLSGKTHRVITAVVVADDEKQQAFYEITEVDVATLREEAIRYYIDRCKPYDKAGAYAIQEWLGLTQITAIRGCYYNVVGLPMPRLWQVLQEQGSG